MKITMDKFTPAYIKTLHDGLLAEKIDTAYSLLEKCSICPRNCGDNRIKGETGFCRAGILPKVASYSPHFGEERPLVGHHGSGTIFLTHCNLGCIFCQNYSISHLNEGQEITPEKMAKLMIDLQHLGCHNINFVSPTHYVPQILKSIQKAAGLGLQIPLVYNTGGYDSVSTLKLLDGVFDIYMPDLKYTLPEISERYSLAPDYPEKAKLAIQEMHRQVGDLTLDRNGIALRGLLVRHLVLPLDLAGSREAMRFLSTEISRNTYVNIMAQYHPCGEVSPDSPMARRITRDEFLRAVRMAQEEGITRLDE
jgi:putative pyruvate formate lyase activating enzyme